MQPIESCDAMQLKWQLITDMQAATCSVALVK